MTLKQLQIIDTIKAYGSINDCDRIFVTLLDSDHQTLELKAIVELSDGDCKYFTVGEYSFEESEQAFRDFETLKRIFD